MAGDEQNQYRAGGAWERLTSQVIPPQVFGPMLPMQDVLVTFTLRGPDMDLEDPPTARIRFPLTQLLDRSKRYLRASELRPHHIKWARLQDEVDNQLGVALSFETSEIGFAMASGSHSPDTYLTCASEEAWLNAVSLMRQGIGGEGAGITFVCFHPKPSKMMKRHRNPYLEDDELARPPSTAHTQVPCSGRSHISEIDLPTPDASRNPEQTVQIPPPAALEPAHVGDGQAGGSSAGKTEDSDVKGRHVSSADGTRRDRVTIDSWNSSLDQPTLPDRADYAGDDDYAAALGEYNTRLLAFQQRRAWDLAMRGGSNVCSGQIWETSVCRVLRCDPEKTWPEYCVKIRGSARDLLPVQAHGVVFIFWRINGVEGGCWLSHIMGIGKTTQVITVHIIQHSFNGMWKEIEEHPESHCTDHERCVGRCPSNQKMLDEFGYDCPCCETSPTHFIKARLGLTIFAVPTQLLRTWQREWSMCKPCDWHGQPIKMLKCHNTAGDGDEKLEGDNRDLALGRNLTVCYKRERRQPSHLGPRATVQRKWYGPVRVEGRLENGMVVILTTVQSFLTQFVNKLSVDEEWLETPYRIENKANQCGYTQNRDELRKHQQPLYVVGLYVKDEAHVVKVQTAANVERLKKDMDTIKWPHPFGIVFLTGTPLFQGPDDIIGLTLAMRRPEWQHHAQLKTFDRATLDLLVKRWDSAGRRFNKTGDAATLSAAAAGFASVMKELAPLCGVLMLYVTHDNLFLGRFPVVKKPTLVVERLYVGHAEHWVAHVDNLERQMRIAREETKAAWDELDEVAKAQNPLTHPAPFYRERVCASFPALDTITDPQTQQPIKLTEHEWQTNISSLTWSRDVAGRNPYLKHLDAILQSSAKVQPLEDTYARFKDRRDIDRNPASGVFCSIYFAGTAVMYYWLTVVKRVPTKDIVWIYLQLGYDEVQRRLELFLGPPESDAENLAARHRPRYMVATTGSFNVGLTMDKALFIAMLEPEHRVHYEAQVLARIYRQGNRNPKVHGIIITGNCNVERRVVRKSGVRNEFAKTAHGHIPVEIIEIEDD